MPLRRLNVHSTQYSTESIGNLGTKIWNLVLVHLKDLKGPSTFKNQIKKWIAKVCPCCLCKVRVAQVVEGSQKFASFRGVRFCLLYSFSLCFILF